MNKWIAAALIIIAGCGMTYANGLGFFATYWDAKDLDSAIGAGAKLQMEMAPNVALELRGSYLPEFEDEKGGLTMTLDVIPLEADLVLQFPVAPDQMKIYVGGGVGYYMIDGELEGGGGTADFDPDDEVGYFALAGAEFIMSPQVSLFAEAKYTFLEVEEGEVTYEDESVELEDLEGEMDGFGANIGLLMTW